jgi:hypothetical protein
MRELGVKGLPTRRLPKDARLGKVTWMDLVARNFRRDGRDLLWMTDITEHSPEGKIYCCVVLHAFSRFVAGWSIDSTQTTTIGAQRARDGHPPALGSGRFGHSLRPRGPIHVVGLQPERSRRQPGAIDGRHRQPLRQRDGRSGAARKSRCSTARAGRQGSSSRPRSTDYIELFHNTQPGSVWISGCARCAIRQ